MIAIRRATVLLPFFLAVAAPAAAQLTPPPAWKWVTDEPARLETGQDVPDSAFRFVRMPPGWHVTMGPGGALYDPRYAGEGRFSLETEIFLFPGTTQEGYGIFVGGRAMEGSAPQYVAFVVARDGSAAVVEWNGAAATVLATAKSDAVLPQAGEEAVKNILRVDVDGREAVFLANRLELLRLPLEGRSLDGQFGFRVGRGINLHATRLDFTQRFAPVPAPR